MVGMRVKVGARMRLHVGVMARNVGSNITGIQKVGLAPNPHL